MVNAIRYTPAGGTIRLGAIELAGKVRIQATDTGKSIPPENLPFVLGRSFRGAKARQLENGESGLGLAIAKSLVEAQGGVISVTSLPGQGSTFTIELPVGS